MTATEEKLNQVKPQLKAIVEDILLSLTSKGYQPIVAEGLRTIEQERQKVAQGNSQTMHSKHLTGDAVDIVDERYEWNIPLNHQFWMDYGNEVLSHPELRWGGIWYHPERLPIYEKSVATKNEKLITWFADVAHCELK